MKTKMNLTQLAQQEMNNLAAGYDVWCDEAHCCSCGCKYADQGGSSSNQNLNANYSHDLYSPL